MTKDNKPPEGDTLDWRQKFDDIFYEPPSLYMGSAFGDQRLDEAVKAFIEQTISKELEKEREETRSFLEDSSVWDMEYIYQRKAMLLKKFDEQFNK